MRTPEQEVRLSAPTKYALAFRTVIVLLVGLGVVSCGGIKLGQSAADDAFRAVGKAADEVVLPQDDLERLTNKYSLNADVVKRVAPEAASVPAWSLVTSKITAIYKAANDEESASAATGIGCEALTGQIETEADLQKSLANALVGMSPNRLLTIRIATQELQKELAKVKRDGTEEDKAAALWACYSLGVVS